MDGACGLRFGMSVCSASARCPHPPKAVRIVQEDEVQAAQRSRGRVIVHLPVSDRSETLVQRAAATQQQLAGVEMMATGLSMMSGGR
jgi:hypothetical protein